MRGGACLGEERPDRLSDIDGRDPGPDIPTILQRSPYTGGHQLPGEGVGLSQRTSPHGEAFDEDGVGREPSAPS